MLSQPRQHPPSDVGPPMGPIRGLDLGLLDWVEHGPVKGAHRHRGLMENCALVAGSMGPRLVHQTLKRHVLDEQSRASCSSVLMIR